MKPAYLLSVALSMLLTVACSKTSELDEPTQPTPTVNNEITLNESDLVLSDTDTKGTISFKATADWHVSVSDSRAVPSWITVEPMSGKAGEVTLTVTAQANTDYDDRNAVITISSGAVNKAFTLFQKKKNALILSKEIFELTGDQSTIDVEVKSNVDFEVKILDEWITQVQSRGLTTHQLKFAVASNDSEDNREGKIVIKDKASELADTVHVLQAQSNSLVLTQKEYSVPEDGDVIEVILKSNVDYTVQMPDAEWIEEVRSRSMQTYKHKYKILPNETYDGREAQIIFKDKASDLSDTVFIYQTTKDALLLSKNRYEVDMTGGNIDVEVKSNVDFEVKILDEWITQVQSRGLTTHQLKFAVASNGSEDNREGKIVIKDKASELADTVHVFQAQSNSLVLTQKEYSVPEDGDVIEVILKSNVDYTVQMPDAGWIEEVQSRSMQTYKHKYKILPNETYDGREAQIIFKDKVSELADTVFIYQTTKDALLLSKNRYEVDMTGGNIDVEIKTNVDFEVKILDGWITQVQSRGLTTHQLKFAVASNDSDGDREGKIVIKSKTSESADTIRIYQTSADAMFACKSIYEVGNEGGIIDVEIKSSVGFGVSVLDDWITPIQSRGLSTYHQLFTIAANNTSENREGRIVLMDFIYGLRDTIHVFQTQDNSVVLTQKNFLISENGDLINVVLKSGSEYTIQMPNVDWLKEMQPQSSSIYKYQYKILPNETYDGREAQIIFKDKSSELADTVFIYQTTKDALLLSQKRYEVEASGGNIDVEVKSNVEIHASCESDWITQVQSRGLTTHQLKFAIKANDSSKKREGIIVFKKVVNNLMNGGIDTIYISQGVSLNIGRNKYEVEPKKSIISEIHLTTDDYEMQILDDWISEYINDYNGVNRFYPMFEIKANHGEERIGKIVFIDNKNNLTDTVSIIQSRGDVEGIAGDRAALIALYNSTGGQNWKQSDNWCSDKPMDEWYGVSTNELGRVVSLYFNDNNLTGSLPSEIGDLKQLEGLDLSDNNISELHENLQYLPLKSLTINDLNDKGKLTYIPEYIGNITTLKNLILCCNSTISGPVPASFGNLTNLESLWLSGKITSLPDELGNLTKLTDLQIIGPLPKRGTISGTFPQWIGNLRKLKYLTIQYFDLPGTIPESLYDLTDLEDLNLSMLSIDGTLSNKIGNLQKLSKLTIQDTKMSGPIPSELTSIKDLETLNLAENNFSGSIPYGFSSLDKLRFIHFYGNRLSGIVPDDFEQNPNSNTWDFEQQILRQQSGYILSFGGDLYASTDFSADGQVITLQKATKGNGIDIVLMGDGFVDRDMVPGGKYEQVMQEACGYLFALEPMKSYMEYFNVYAVKAVSLNEKYRSGASTVFNVSFTGGDTGTQMGGNNDKCFQYAQKAPIKSITTTTIGVIANTNSHSGTAYFYGSGEAIGYCAMEDEFQLTFIHEVVGHGFGKLADEYVTYYGETIPADKRLQAISDYNNYGWHPNVDYTSEPSQIRWKHMLKDPQFSSYTSIVLGGDHYDDGVWRPEERSMMRDNDMYFNAPSREAIVKRIMRLAGEEYSFEKFVAKDKYEPIGTLSRSSAVDESKIVHNPSPVIVRR